jgi:hypothetical protein
MIIVTGTKRSGTSMWMQILVGAGFPAFGDAFPLAWGTTALRAANQEGFYESTLRSGIYYATNPNPRTGAYFFPEQVEKHAVKVFIPGLARTDRAYIGRVIATMREWREYEASVKRLYAFESESKPAGQAPRPQMEPALEWWWENYLLLRDVTTRRYAIHVQTYASLLADPERVIHETMKWLGHGDAKAACAKVKPENRHFDRPASTSLEPEVAAVADELYAVLHERRGLSQAFLAKLGETNAKLAPRIAEELRRIRGQRRAQRAHRHDPDAIDVVFEDEREPPDDPPRDGA